MKRYEYYVKSELCLKLSSDLAVQYVLVKYLEQSISSSIEMFTLNFWIKILNPDWLN